MTSAPLIAYLRVSTAGQGRSGLGLDGRRKAVEQFAAASGRKVAGEYIEVETGKGADALDRRPQLSAALFWLPNWTDSAGTYVLFPG